MPPPENHAPRIGVPWRTSSEESSGLRSAFDQYLRAVRDAGGEPIEISLLQPASEQEALAKSLDGIVLSGSPADIEPRRFGAVRHPKTAPPDKLREHADDLLLAHAFETAKPVLAICFGIQSLNIHLGGSLVQDIPSELHSEIDHDSEEGASTRHPVRIDGGMLAELAPNATVRVNSSHHQSVSNPGRGLRVTAVAPDGVIEALEWTAGPSWVVGVQWHPERMMGDPLADALFRRLVQEARSKTAAPAA